MIVFSGSLKAVETDINTRVFGINFVPYGAYGLKLKDILPVVGGVAAGVGGAYLIGKASQQTIMPNAVVTDKPGFWKTLGAGLTSVVQTAGGVALQMFQPSLVPTVPTAPPTVPAVKAPVTYPPGVMYPPGQVVVLPDGRTVIQPTTEDMMGQLGKYMPYILVGGGLLLVLMMRR